jgi:hypothetical protein
MKVTIGTIFGNYDCRSFTNVDPDEYGIEISKNGNYIGIMVGEELPDDDDDDFINKLEIWLSENE